MLYTFSFENHTSMSVTTSTLLVEFIKLLLVNKCNLVQLNFTSYFNFFIHNFENGPVIILVIGTSIKI